MEGKMVSEIESGEYEFNFRRSLGIMIIKPDAVQLGVAEELIYHVTTKLYQAEVGALNGVYIVQIENDYVPSLYPNISGGVGKILRDYLSEEISVITTFKGNGQDDLWQFLHRLKGTRLMDRKEEQLETSMGIETGIRDIIPLPGTRQRYEDAFAKLKQRIRDKTLPFTDEEYQVYCRNLIHTPDDLREAIALVNILNEPQIKENIPIREFRKLQKYFNLR